MQLQVDIQEGSRFNTVDLFGSDLKVIGFRLLSESEKFREELVHPDARDLVFISLLFLDEVCEGLNRFQWHPDFNVSLGRFLTSGHTSSETPRALEHELCILVSIVGLEVLDQSLQARV